MSRRHCWAFERRVVRWLRREREKYGISQGAVAANCGKFRPAVSEIEAGRQRLTVADLYGYAAALNYPVSYIIEQAGMPTSPALLACQR